VTRLSVNINKIATLRNARGGEIPNVVQAAIKCEAFGAQGITVHPRPDERHITRRDVYDLAGVVKTEFNIEGYPDERYLAMVLEVKPVQATLVPDGPDVLTSNTGWDTVNKKEFLKPLIRQLQAGGIRVSVFVDPSPEMIRGAAALGADRVELYTGHYALDFHHDREKAIQPYQEAATEALRCKLGLNAGHDLDQQNLGYFVNQIPAVDEVSIGHALISESLYDGLEYTIRQYLSILKQK